MSKPTYSRMNETWQPPQELTGPTPRKVTWTKTGKINLYVTGFVVVFGFLVVLAFLGNALGDHELQTQAKEAEGNVDRKYTQPVRGATYHYVAYTFSVAGQIYHGYSHTPNSKWQELSPGSTLVVRYVPWNPSNNRADIAFPPVTMPYWVPLLVFALWIGSMFLASHDVRKERALLMHGQAAAALILTDNSGKRIPKYGWVTGYEFQLPDGSMRKGATQRDRTYMKGSTVCVLYDPKRPRRSGIYPLRMSQIVE